MGGGRSPMRSACGPPDPIAGSSTSCAATWRRPAISTAEDVMRFLDEHRRRPASLADHLPWAALVTPGVVSALSAGVSPILTMVCILRSPDPVLACVRPGFACGALSWRARADHVASLCAAVASNGKGRPRKAAPRNMPRLRSTGRCISFQGSPRSRGATLRGQGPIA